MALSDNLTKFRNRLNLSRKEVADKIGVSLPAYGNYESGNRAPNLELLPKLAAVLNVSIDELLGYSRPIAEEEVQIARLAGVEVKEENGLYSISGFTSPAWKSLDDLEKAYIDIAKERLNLAPLPASEFIQAVRMARGQTLLSNPGRFIFWLYQMIDFRNVMLANKHIPPEKIEMLERMEREEKKQPPASE